MTNVDSSYAELKTLFIANQNLDYALAMKAYMKGKFDFYGLKSAERREIQKPFVKSWQELNSRDFKMFILQCWSEDYRDWQYIAIDAMRKYLKKMDASYLNFTINLIEKKSWWDTVDLLASNIIGPLLSRYPEGKDARISEWITSGHMWVERTAIIHQLKYKNDTDAALLSALIEIKKDDKAFFIQKSIGWSLRQLSRHKPGEVLNILEQHPELSTLAQREARKYLP